MDVDEKVDQQDQKHALQTAVESLQAPVNRCIRRHIDVVSDETGWGTQANMRDTTPIHQFDFGGSTAQENVRESEGVDLAEKHVFSVHEKTTAVDDLNSVKSLHFDEIPRSNCPDLLSNAFGSLQQRGNVPESESILHVSNQKRFLQNLHVSDNAACELKNSAQTVFDSGDLRQHPGQRLGEMGSVGTPEHRSTGSHKHAADLCEALKTGLQAVDERVNSAIPRVFASNSVVQHALHLSDVVDTIGQLAHSQTDPLGHAATAADRDTQSTRAQKSLTAAIIFMFLHSAMKNNVYSNRPTQFPSPNSSYTHERVRQS